MIKYAVKYSTIIEVAFITIALIIIGNLNGLITAIVGIKAPLSPLILLNTTIILILLFFIKPVLGRFDKLTWFFIAFLFSYVFIGLVSGLIFYQEYHPKASITGGLRRILPSFIIFYATYLYSNLQGERRVMMRLIERLTIISFITVLLIIFANQLGITSDFTGNNDSSRAAGLFANPNGAGLASSYCLALSMFCIFHSKRWLLVWIAISSMSLYAAVITFSKAAIIVSIGIVGLYILYLTVNFHKNSFSQKSKILAILVVFMVSTGYAIVKLQTFLASLEWHQLGRIEDTIALLSGKIDKTTTSERSEIWSVAFDKILENPILGYGLESFHRLEGVGLGVHNTFLMVWGESGIVVVSMFVIFLLYILIKSFRMQSPAGTILIVSLTAVFIAQDAMTSHNALENKLSMMMIGVACSLLYHRRIKLS